MTYQDWQEKERGFNQVVGPLREKIYYAWAGLVIDKKLANKISEYCIDFILEQIKKMKPHTIPLGKFDGESSKYFGFGYNQAVIEIKSKLEEMKK